MLNFNSINVTLQVKVAIEINTQLNSADAHDVGWQVRFILLASSKTTRRPTLSIKIGMAIFMRRFYNSRGRRGCAFSGFALLRSRTIWADIP